MKISSLIFLSFLFILLLFSVTTFINRRQSEKVKDNAEYLSRSFTVVRQSTRFQRNILNMISGWRGYMLTGEKFFIEPYDSASVENDAILSELDMLLKDSRENYKTLLQLKDLNAQWTNDFTEPLLAAKQMAERSDTALLAFNRLYRQKITSEKETALNRKLQEKVKEIINKEYEIRNERSQILAQSIQKTKNISFYLNVVSILLGALVAAFLAYGISSRILKMVKMANTISEGNYSVKIDAKGRDELSKLAKALNHMAKTLGENISMLKRKNQELDQFAQIVSHDLKTPLRGIDNVITWMEEDHSREFTPKVKEYITLIKGRVERTESLIGGILSYAKIGKETQPKEMVNVDELIDEVVETSVVNQDIKITKGPMPNLFTERLPLLQVFSNLISNAVKHHDKLNGTVSITHIEHEDRYEFLVEDNGPGISPQYHSKIFMIFQTLKESNGITNTGVGLAIVKKILDERDQQINITSIPGVGTTFSFTWPK
jgi:signal transduction histidine kinase